MSEIREKDQTFNASHLLPVYGAALLVSSALSDVLFALIMGVSLYRIWKAQARPSFQPRLLWLPVLALFGWVVVCWVFKEQWTLAAKFLPKWRWVLILFFLNFSFFTFWSNELLKRTTVALSAAAIVHSLYCVFQFFIPYNLVKFRWEPLIEHLPGVGLYRPQGFFYVTIVTAATFAIYILFALSVRLFAQISFSRRQKIIVDMAIGSSAVAMLLSFSRGPIVAVIASGLLLLAFKNWKWSLIGFVSAVGLVIGLATFESPFQRRVVDALDGTDGAMNQRPVLWAAHAEMFKENPMTGVSFGNNERTSVEFIRPYMHKIGNTEIHPTHAHNTYLQFLAATGAVGLVLLLSVFAAFGTLSLKTAMGNSRERFLGISGLTILMFIMITSLMDYLFVGVNLYQMVFFMSMTTVAYFKNIQSSEP